MGVAQTWNSTYENNPIDGSSPANGDDEIRNLKTSVRGILNKEHWHGFETGPTDTNTVGVQGLHRNGSAMPFISSSTPTTRADGSAFTYEHDYGRIWIDLSEGGKLKYLNFTDPDDDGTAVFQPVIQYSIGEITHFAFTPADEDRWCPADGRTITKSDTSIDGSANGYSALIDALFAETGGDSSHPYYVQADGNAVKLPDLRGAVIRSLSDLTAAGSVLGERVDPDDATQKIDHESDRFSGSYQRDKLYDHIHKMDHAHGGAMVTGNDSGDGRTGQIDTWTAGTPAYEDETGNWEADSSFLTDNGVLTMRNPNSQQDSGGGGVSKADNVNTTVDLQHYHVIPRYNGLTRNISDSNIAADTSLGLPEVDQPYAVEGTVKNVALYPFIRY